MVVFICENIGCVVGYVVGYSVWGVHWTYRCVDQYIFALHSCKPSYNSMTTKVRHMVELSIISDNDSKLDINNFIFTKHAFNKLWNFKIKSLHSGY